jgi:molybdenum cofactor guanylyltransferase
MKILGAIIAGGQSSRMGGREKALQAIDGVALIARVASRISFQVDDLVVNANGDPARFAFLAYPVIADEEQDVGTPLAGLHAALAHGAARGFDAVLTVPSDSPFLPLDLVPRLMEAGQVSGAAHARSGARDHYLTGLWTTAMDKPLIRLIHEDGLRRVQDFCRMAKAERAVWTTLPHDPFFNINTPEDLEAAAHIIRGEAG